MLQGISKRALLHFMHFPFIAFALLVALEACSCTRSCVEFYGSTKDNDIISNIKNPNFSLGELCLDDNLLTGGLELTSPIDTNMTKFWIISIEDGFPLISTVINDIEFEDDYKPSLQVIVRVMDNKIVQIHCQFIKNIIDEDVKEFVRHAESKAVPSTVRVDHGNVVMVRHPHEEKLE